MATAPAKKATPTADWRYIFLQDIGAPITKGNLFFLDLWARFEGGMSHNNPLNTSLMTKHVTGTWNSSGVRNYDTLANGAHAAAQTLLYTKGVGYEPILTAFRHNAAPTHLASLVEVSHWDAKHYGAYNSAGKYVGGSLLKGALGGLHVSPKPGLGTAIGEAGHYAIHPGAGVEKTGGAAAHEAGKIAPDILHYVLYGLAIAGGGALFMVGFILIAADIGLSKARGSRVGGIGSSALGSLGSDRHAQAAYDNRAYRSSREGISKKDDVKVVEPKHDVSRPLRKQKPAEDFGKVPF